MDEKHISDAQIEDYLDNALDRPEKARMDAHLATCVACTQRVMQVAAMEERLYEVAGETELFNPLGSSVPVGVREPDCELSVVEENLSLPAGPRRGPIVRWLVPAVSLMAACSAGLFFLMHPGPPLPEYQIEVSGGDHMLRSAMDTVGPRLVAEGSRLEVLFRPQERSDVRPQAYVYLDQVAPQTRMEGWHLMVGEQGAVLVEGVFGQDLVLPAAGEHRLWVAVGTGELDYQNLVALAQGSESSSEDWLVVPVSLRVEGP